MNRKNLLLIDFNNLLYRAVFANYELSFKGIFTGGLYGFLYMLATQINAYKIDRVVVCMDTKPYLRTKHYPAYKQDRPKPEADEEKATRLAIARKQIENFLDMFSFSIARAKGSEADDFIGAYCRTMEDRYGLFFIMSNDSDFYQLLGGKGKAFLITTKGLYGCRNFEKEFPNLTPEDWPRVVALKGSHNGVPGIKGVGDKISARLVSDGVTNEDIKKKYNHSDHQIKLRTKLATFPFPPLGQVILPRAKRIEYSLLDLEEMCETYGIQARKDFHKALLRISK